MTLNLSLPQKWDDLSPQQLRYVAAQYLAKVAPTQMLVNCALYFSGLQPLPVSNHQHHILLHRYRRIVRIPKDQFVAIVDALQWLHTPVTLFALPAKMKGIRSVNYKLYQVTLEQFLSADSMYMAYSVTGDKAFLDRLAAIAYPATRFKTWKGFRLSRASMASKYIVYMWFTSVKAWLIDKYPYLYSGSSEGAVDPVESVMSLLNALSQGDVTKNPQVKLAPVHEALDSLNRRAQEVLMHQ